MWRFDSETFRTVPGFDGVYRRVVGRPSWVTKWALIAAAIVVLVPLMLLALAGLVIGTVVFVLLGLIAQVITFVRSGLHSLSGGGSTSTGRRNVRVIHRD